MDSKRRAGTVAIALWLLLSPLNTGATDPGAAQTRRGLSPGTSYRAFLPAIRGGVGTLPPDPSTVAPPLDRTVATDLCIAARFLFIGSQPIQTGVDANRINCQRIAVLRGRVLNAAGQPLAGVQINALSHPEWGQTLTRADGKFDLAANGGGILTVVYQAAGYLPLERQVRAPWQDYTWLPDVTLLPKDGHVTLIDLLASTPIQVARGSVISDTDGIRRQTLLFQMGTVATVTLADGSRQNLTTLHVRATEYTVGSRGPAAMPSQLPPTSGYTYAAELTVDEVNSLGAVKVNGHDIVFSKPVLAYLENFLNFPVGEKVPVGFYDPKISLWVPAEDGRVIKILSITTGMANLDTDGDGLADNGTALGVTLAERQQLATLYPAGTGLWRTPLAHFSTSDLNWPLGCAAGPTGCPPPGGGPQGQVPDQDKQCGSIIGCQNQTLGQAVDIAGTPFQLSYQSDRVPGYLAANTVRIPTIPGCGGTYAGFSMIIQVAGQVIYPTFGLVPPAQYAFTWDGKDGYGRTVQGRQRLTVSRSCTYPANYMSSAGSSRSFAMTSDTGVRLSENRTRMLLAATRDQVTAVGAWDARPQGLGGWSLSIHHAYDPVGRELFLGDGGWRKAQGRALAISTVAGSASSGYGGDNGPATSARLANPVAVTPASDGSFYIADYSNQRIRLVDRTGVITTVAGIGLAGYSGDNGPATLAKLNYPQDVTLGPDGSLYIADTANNRIRRVDANGTITTVAGNGTAGFGGDGGPATQAQLNTPTGIAFGPDGALFIADSYNSRIRRVGPDGTINTVVGSGNWLPLGDGGPAKQAGLNVPHGVFVGPDGSLYIADTYHHSVRRVGLDGNISTVAGTGIEGFSGDDGLATQAWLKSPARVALDDQGNLYIADVGNQRVRVVDTRGYIETFAGSNPVELGDGGPAMRAGLSAPEGVAAGPDGAIYIADTRHHRIRRVGPALPGSSSADISIPAEDGSEVYVFNSLGRHLRTLDALTGVVRYRFMYDGAGRLTTVVDGDGNATAIERNASGNATAIIGPYGQRTTLTLDANGYLSWITNPVGEAVQAAYTAGGLMTTFTDPRGGIHRFTYDVVGRLVRDSDPAGGSIDLARYDDDWSSRTWVTTTNALSRTMNYMVYRMTDGGEGRVNTLPNELETRSLHFASGRTEDYYPDKTKAAIDVAGDPRWGLQAPIPSSYTADVGAGIKPTLRMSRIVTPDNTSDPFSFDAIADRVVVNGLVYTSQYVSATRSFTQTTPGGRQVKDTVDAHGRVVRDQVASLLPTTLAYDGRGRLITSTQGSGTVARVTRFAYDSAGYLSTITDPLGHSTTLVRDATGRVIRRVLADGRVIGYTYDANSNLTSITPPGRSPHAFTFTPVDLISSYAPPNLGSPPSHYAYDVAGGLMQFTASDSTVVTMGYDTAGRLSTVTLPRGTLTYTYDVTTGLPAAVLAPAGVNVTFGFSGALLMSERWSGPVGGSVGRGYDDNLQLVTQTVNSASPLVFRYDPDGLVTQAESLSLVRDPQNGMLVGSTLGAVADTRSYNGFAEPVGYSATVNGGPLYSFQLEYDPLGRVTKKVEVVGGVIATYDYAYDVVGRLVLAKKNAATTQTYTYDSNNNRLSDGVLSGTYDAQDRLTQYGATQYTYTAGGDLLTKVAGGQTTTFTYDVIGNLMQVILPNGTRIDYLVDGQDRRVGKRVNGTLVQGFLYQDRLRPAAELDTSGNIVSRFVYAGQERTPDYMIKGGSTYRIVSDPLGSPRLVINTATGAVAQRMDFDEFGRVLSDSTPGFQPFGFAGGLYDPDTALVRFGARDYDGLTGRWTTKDPALFAGGGTNLYEYAASDPVNLVDPEGTTIMYKKYPGGAVAYRSTVAQPSMTLAVPPSRFAGMIGGVSRVLLGQQIAKAIVPPISQAIMKYIRNIGQKPPSKYSTKARICSRDRVGDTLVWSKERGWTLDVEYTDAEWNLRARLENPSYSPLDWSPSSRNRAAMDMSRGVIRVR